MMVLIVCYNCNEKFDEEEELLKFCFVCRKCFCVYCYSRHKHESIENNFEQLHDIIKSKTGLLYKPVRTYNWNNLEEIAMNGIIDCLTWKCISYQKVDFFAYHNRLLDIQKRFKYLLLNAIK